MDRDRGHRRRRTRLPPAVRRRRHHSHWPDSGGAGQLNTTLAGHAHPRLGPGTVHASLIAGGTEESTIPDRCLLTIERRTLPGETAEVIEAEVARLLDVCRDADPALVVSSRTTLAREPLETGDDEPIVAILRQTTEQVLGRSADVTAMSFWADSAFLAAAGIPTVLFGPIGDGAHADVEWVSIRSTDDCARPDQVRYRFLRLGFGDRISVTSWPGEYGPALRMQA